MPAPITPDPAELSRLRNRLTELHIEQQRLLVDLLPLITSGDPASALQDIQSTCRAWQLNDQYRMGYENCARLLLGRTAEILIHEAKEEASESRPPQ
jgi:hypothetical protein